MSHHSSKQFRIDRIIESWLISLTPHSSVAYGGVIVRLRRSVGEGRLLVVTDAALIDFVMSQSRESMRRRAVAAIHSFYRFAEKHGHVDRDPSRDIYLKKLRQPNAADVVLKLRTTGIRQSMWRYADYLAKLSNPRASGGLEIESLNNRDRLTLLISVIHRLSRCKSESDLRKLLRRRLDAP